MFEAGNKFQHKRFKLDIYAVSFTMNVCFYLIDLKRRWQILPLFCPKFLDMAYR